MKVFVADKAEKGCISSTDYHWCNDGDLLMFGQFQLDNDNPSCISMCGINSRQFTTHIIVKDLNIDRNFYIELIIDSVEKAFNTIVEPTGWFFIEIGGNVFEFNIDSMVQELLDKASIFNDGQKVMVKGRSVEPL